MCGILGFYNFANQDNALASALAALAHRGPDASGTFSFVGHGASVVLGHRRLSIIDLSTDANQPFVKHGLALTYNGEIYNYRELAKELSAEGISFRTKSDTEVLLEAFRRWGPACLSRLRGMFAFALLDTRTGHLFLARDHFGIKPLFVMRRAGGILFSSELKAIKTAANTPLALDWSAVVASLMYYWVPETRCVYKEVTKLPPGSWAEIAPDGSFRTGKFWDAARELAAPADQLVDVAALRETIRGSVAAHLVADVPVSCFLSGGLDSSLLAAIAVDLGHRLDGYTISFRANDHRFEDMPSDLPYAERIAAKLGIKLHTIEIAPDIVAMLPQMVNTLDEPIGDPAAINTLLICQAARAASVKVLLSGMGADELFAGYRKHYACLLARKYQTLPRFLRKGVIEPIVAKLPVAGRHRGYRTVRWAKRFQTFASLPEEAAFRRSYTQYDEQEFLSLLDASLRPAVDDLLEEHAQIYREGPADDQVNRMCYADLRLFMPGLNLAYTDRASMAASTEVRVPYVDKEVVAAAFRISGREKIVGTERKAILKKAAELWLPKDIIYRSKALFSAPLRAWVRRDLREQTESLTSGTLVRSGFLNGKFIRQLIDSDRSGAADRSKEIWQLLTLETWFQRERVAA